MKSTSLLATSLMILGLLLPTHGALAQGTPSIAVELPEQYNTPDGMAVGPDGDILLSCPNFGNPAHPAKILTIGKDDTLSEVITLPLHPETGSVGPLGVDAGADGNIYVADNQAFSDETHKSRLLRVVMKDGKAVKCEAVVTGFIMSNAVACYGDSVYVTETKIDPAVYPLQSGVYRFKYSELKGAPIKLLPGGKDPHLITAIETKNKDWQVGANGLGFAADGAMFFANFGDCQLIKTVLDKDGKVVSQKVFAQGGGMQSCDGLKIHPKTGDIYIADFVGNAVHKVDAKTAKVTTLAQNGNTDGAGGALDKPSEVCIRGDKLYIANIDLTLGDNTYDAPHTISMLTLTD